MDPTTSGADSADAGARSELRRLTKDESGDLDRARRGEKTQKILRDATGRDSEATARDAVAEVKSICVV